MRDIKFRLIKDGKIVGYERHILSRQCGDNRLNVICIQHSRTGEEYDSTEKGSGWWCIWYNRDYFIDHDHKEQYTGLKDKHGKEIYESDKAKDKGGIVHVIEWGGHWDYAGFGLSGKRTKAMGEGPEYYWDALNPLHAKDFEIIGNIHTEPQNSKEESQNNN